MNMNEYQLQQHLISLWSNKVVFFNPNESLSLNAVMFEICKVWHGGVQAGSVNQSINNPQYW